MRVITGKARGMKLAAPEGQDTRPTSDKVKEAMFSIIQFEVEQASVLDLYAGTGQLGIEALSRGAAFCVFIDQSRISNDVIKANLAKTGLNKQSRVAAMDAVSYLQNCKEQFDIILMDPPYAMEGLEQVLSLASARLKSTGVLVCETAKKVQTPETLGEFTQKRVYQYGIAALSVYRRPRENE
ncbi:16S rRNA (guanine(966)-N(2))-methyltransferase RsmD [Acetanaerobacterium elongatum]|uniref:16S rRNA (Guanine(966)-N(2))-methyltransferase RsmD n=1 Tax=Acetanaerobacterium elongatum TaxID=258515 RepID=A0A1G9VJF1_9FIRM|nr:16S rRNA (guanine(966)-N(2))-methyltransferase RsmD [Acetanaerobacterium elongatum]SDM72289.1 16S rRNA (guanine(966)-N(2))-methyltransferase RsmD [Acetanaerobacterium elongatum]